MLIETWVHGNSMQVEHGFPIKVEYRGFAGVLGPAPSSAWTYSGSRWFFAHFSIPVTYDLSSPAEVTVERIMIAKNHAGPRVEFVALHDGMRAFGDRIRVYGRSFAGPSETQVIYVGDPHNRVITSSLGVTLVIRASSADRTRTPPEAVDLEIHSVGARFKLTEAA